MACECRSMSTPKNPEELAKQIEQLVAQYVAESCRAAGGSGASVGEVDVAEPVEQCDHAAEVAAQVARAPAAAGGGRADRDPTARAGALPTGRIDGGVRGRAGDGGRRCRGSRRTSVATASATRSESSTSIAATSRVRTSSSCTTVAYQCSRSLGCSARARASRRRTSGRCQGCPSSSSSSSESGSQASESRSPPHRARGHAARSWRCSGPRPDFRSRRAGRPTAPAQARSRAAGGSPAASCRSRATAAGAASRRRGTPPADRPRPG